MSWLMECLSEGYIKPEELGVSKMPVFKPDGFSVETDSMNNAELGIELLDGMIQKRPMLDMTEGARRLARNISRTKGRKVLDCFLFAAICTQRLDGCRTSTGRQACCRRCR